MSATAALIRKLGEAGATPEMIAIAVEALEFVEAGIEQAASEKRQRNRDRMRVVRARACTNSHNSARANTPSPKDLPESSSTTETYQNPIPPPYRPPALADEFAGFWLAYPNKVGKRAAEAAFRRARQRMDLGGIMVGLERAKRSRAWAEGYIPHPTTWLNQDRWHDEPDESARAPPMTGGMVAAASDEIAYRSLLEKYRNDDEQGRSPLGDQSPRPALPAPTNGSGRLRSVA